MSLNNQSPKVFISYGREDSDVANRLYNELTAYGVSVWYDKESLLPGKNWKLEIYNAIKNSRFFLVLLSNSTVNRRGFINREISEALEQLKEFPDTEVFVIPVRLEECNPNHKTLTELHWVDMFPNWNQGLFKLMKALGINTPQSKQLAINVNICGRCGGSNLEIVLHSRSGIRLGYTIECKTCNWQFSNQELDEPSDELLEALSSKFGSPRWDAHLYDKTDSTHK